MSNALTTAPAHPPSSTDTDGRAVEVVATFGDSVVGVRHVSDPRGGVVRAATKAMLAAGAALMATSALAFGYATHIADKNEAALEAHVAKGKPAWSFRPERLPRSLDGLMIGGSAIGMGLFVWGLSRRRSEKNPSNVRVGNDSGADFAVDSVGTSFDLVAPAGDGFALQVVPGMAGELRTAAGAQALVPNTTIPVTADLQARFQLGKLSFRVSSVPAARKTATAGLGLDKRTGAFIAASALAHIGLVGLLATVPNHSDTGQGDDDASEFALAHSEMDSSERQVEEVDQTKGGETGPDGGSSTPSMRFEEGTTGSENPNLATDMRRRQIKRDQNLPPSMAYSNAVKLAVEGGLLGSHYVEQGDLIRSMAGAGPLSVGFDDMDLEGGWMGDGDGVPGGFADGRKGPGPGGGGTEWGPYWSPDYKTIDDGRPGGEDFNIPGSPDGKRPERDSRTPKPRWGQPKCEGSVECDPSIIKRYMKRHASKFAYCYEKELLAHPGMSGTVDIFFTVLPNGTVRSASASGVSEAVSSCMANVVSNVNFPKFSEIFQVRYPIHVRPAGS